MPPRKTGKKAKPPKDLNAPKRPPSSYLLFNSNRQKTLKEQHPDKKLTELTKLVGAEWKTLTPQEKEPFDREASELKEKYKADLEEYQQTDLYRAFQAKLEKWKARQADGGESDSDDDDDEDEAPVATKRPKDPNAPKKPLSAFFIFQTRRRQELKEEHPDKKNTELSKMTGAEWKAMSAEDKQPFEAKAKVLKQEYETTLAAYKQTDEYQQYQAKVKAWQESKKRKAAKKKKKKKAPSPSPAESSEDSSSDDDAESSDGDGDTNMQSRRATSTDDEEEYSSDSD